VKGGEEKYSGPPTAFSIRGGEKLGKKEQCPSSSRKNRKARLKRGKGEGESTHKERILGGAAQKPSGKRGGKLSGRGPSIFLIKTEKIKIQTSRKA